MRRESIVKDIQHKSHEQSSSRNGDMTSSNVNGDASMQRRSAPYCMGGNATTKPIPRPSAGIRMNLQERAAASHQDPHDDYTSTRAATFFRLSRASFSKKKPIDRSASNGSASPAATNSFESQRSTTSAGSSSGPGTRESRIQSQASSPIIYRSHHLDSWPRPSVSSSREGEWISDMGGDRASSDLDSLTGRNGRPWLLMNRSSTSLSSSSIAEDPEMMETFQSANSYTSSISPKSIRPPLLLSPTSIHDRTSLASSSRLKSARSISAFTTMRRQVSEDAAFSKRRDKVPLHHTPSTPSLRDHYNLPIPKGSPTLLPSPPLPDARSAKTSSIHRHLNHISPPDQRMQRDSLMVPSSSSSTKTLRKTKSQNSFRELMRKSSFIISKKGDADLQEQREEQKENVKPMYPSSVDLTDALFKDRNDRNFRKSMFRSAKPRLTGADSSRIASSSRSSLLSSGFNSPISSSPVQERLQPFFARSTSKESLSTSSDRKSYGSIQPLIGRDRERSSSAATSRHASPSGNSKLQSNGGAAGLFTTKTQRQRASSLLPTISWRTKGNNTSRKLSTPSSKVNNVDASVEEVEEKKRPSLPKVDVLQFNGDAEEFVQFVLATVSRDDVAAVLASSSDDIYKRGLAHFMQRFSFKSDPLDIALRKLLMSLCLPKETQQIDRVMEAFAQRYNDCNEGLFDNVDQPYVLAFSLMMLHTDAFNKNAKQKMSKMEYIRNTSSCGVPADILEYLYDNLTFTQFIYVDDDETLSRRKSEGEPSSSIPFLSALSSTTSTPSTKSRIDPYFIIANGQTHTLHADVASFINSETPFAATGTSTDIDIDRLNQTFVNAPTIEIITTRKPILAATTTAVNIGSESNAIPPSGSATESDEEVVVTLRVTKIGCVSRKDDIVEENKKASSRRWKTCGMVLSSSQLLFFKDLVWVGALHQQIKEQIRTSPPREGGIVITPRMTQFRPDGVLALSDVIAVHDKSYIKYQNVLRLFAKQGESYRQYLIQAASEEEMNDWIHRINFCAAFRACGLRIRGVDLPATPSPDDDSMGRASMSLTRAELDTARASSSSSSSSDLQSKIRNGEPSSISDMMQWKLHARRSELLPKLELVNAKYAQCQEELDKKMRFAKHLGVLTPFMKITRDKIEASAISLARQVRAIRLELAKYQNRRQILILELEAGDRAAKSSALARAIVDISTTEDLAEDAILTSSISLDRLSLPTPSSSFSIHDSSTSRSSNGSYDRPPPTMTSTTENDYDVATPKVTMSHMNQIDDLLSANNQSSPSHQEMLEKPALSGRHSKAAPTLHGLGLDDLLEDAALPSLQLNDNNKQVSHTRASTEFKTPRHWTRTIYTPPSPREEAERWDRSKVVNDTKRVSLATLPDAEHLMDLSRVSLLYASGAMVPDDE